MNSPDQPMRHTIDGVEYICHVQAAIPANQSLIKLMGVISPPTLALLSGAVRGFASDGEGELTLSGLGNMDLVTGLVMLFQELTPEAATVILQEGFRGISTPELLANKLDLSEENTFNEHFRGHLIRMYKVFAWSLRCNYQDFFAVASQVNVSLLTRLAKRMKLNKQKPQDTSDSQTSTSQTVIPSSSDLSAQTIQ